ncbi:MAG: GNAT family N-acetyltransferase [Prolixibacteraceae bacterium]
MIVNELIVSTSITMKLLKIKDASMIYHEIDQNRIYLRKWLPFVDSTRSVNDTLTFVKAIAEDVEHRQEIFTIWYQNEFAGLIGLKDFDFLNRKVEIGYWLIEKMTRKGIITQSVERIMTFLFEKMEINRIQIKCGVGNSASSAVPKRLGFEYEGIERQGERHRNKFIDLEIYSFLKENWK